MIVSRLRMTATVVAALVLVAGCSSHEPGKVVTVTVAPPATSSTAPSGGPGLTSTSAGASPSVSPSVSASGPAPQTKLPGTCDSLLPDYTVGAAVGKAAFPGKDAFVVGVPDTGIHRLAYLNCQYGVTGSAAAPARQLEIGVSLYSTAADAAQRISATVDDYTNHGAQSQDVKVADLPATLLTGGIGDGYSDPLLVVAAGQRTVAVTVTKAVAVGDKAATDASKLAALVITKTAP